MTTTTAPRARHSGARRAAIGAGAFALLATGILTAGGAPATAAPVAPPGSATTTVENSKLIGSGQNQGVTKIYVYVDAGESLYTSFESVYTPGWLDTDIQTGKIVIKDPTGAVAYDSGPKSAPSGVFGGTFTSATAGVWVVETHDPDISGLKTANFDWQIAALDSAGSSIPGRMFFESLGIHSILDKFSDMELTAINAQGAQYQVNLRGYNGVNSAINMNNIGNAKAGTAESVFKSVPAGDSTELDTAAADYWQPRTADQAEGLQPFRMFFEAPDTSLPLGDVPWGDGRTGDKWVNAELKTPEVDVTEFARESAASNAGTVKGTLANAYGLVKVQIDANGNGSYDDPEDVSKNVQVNKPGSFSLKWDGKDSTGKATGLEVPVSFKASMSQTNPIHFVRDDVEYSEGGIEMVALNGPNAGENTVYWDDTMFEGATSAERSSTSTPLDGTAGVSSTGGVHTWVAGQQFPNQNNSRTGSHGDQRAIDDWTFQKFDAADELKIDPVAASISIVKYINGEDANEAPGVIVEPGKDLDVKYIVTNTGGQTLNDVKVTDDKIAAENIKQPKTTLAPGESMEVTATVKALKPGEQHTNIGTVVGTPPSGPPVKSEDPGNATLPGIKIVKAINGDDANQAPGVEAQPGEDLNVTFDVTNIGKVPLTDVKVTDDMIKATDIKQPKTTLAPGETMQVTATLKALEPGTQHTNIGTVTGTPPKGPKVTDDDPANATIPSIEIVKFIEDDDANEAPGYMAGVGQDLDVQFKVTNTGKTVLTDISIADDKIDAKDIKLPKTELKPGESMIATAVLPALEPGVQHTNIGTVTGTTPKGGKVTDDDPANATIPSIEVVKLINGDDANEAPGVKLDPNADAQVTFQVTNTGKADLKDVVVTDDTINAEDITCPATELAAGASMDCTATLPALGDGVNHVNIGTVTGTPPTGPNVADEDPANAFTPPAPGAPAPSSDGSSLATTGAEAAGIGAAIGAGALALLGGAWFVIRNRRRAKAE